MGGEWPPVASSSPSPSPSPSAEHGRAASKQSGRENSHGDMLANTLGIWLVLVARFCSTFRFHFEGVPFILTYRDSGNEQ